MNKSLSKIGFLVIIFLQTLTICYWAGEKSNYNIDEFYSTGYAQNFASADNKLRKLTTSDKWQYETWIENSVLTDQLNLSDEESLLSQGPLTIIKKLLFKKYSYYGLLNISTSLFSDGKMSMTPGLILNIILFLITQLLVFSAAEEITGSRIISLFAVLMYGFSMVAISMATYIRFYSLTIPMSMAVIRLHQVMWRTENPLRCELMTLLSMALLLIAMRNSQLIFLFGTGLIFSYGLGLFVKRQYKKMILYLAAIVPAGLYYVCTKTNYFQVIFHPKDFLNTTGAEKQVAYWMLKTNLTSLLSRARLLLSWLCYMLIGSRYVFFAFVIIITILAALWIRKKRKEPVQKTAQTGFCWILFGVTVIYTIAALIGNLYVVRYVSTLFPIITILLWSLINLFTQGKSFRKPVLIAFILMTCAGITFGELRHSENIQYIYRRDRPLTQMLADSGIDSAIVIFGTKNSSSEHAAYDCIGQLPDNAKLYIVDEARHSIDVTECPDEMLIWASRVVNKTLDPYTDDLTAGGYEIYKLGRNHTSDVYVARRTASGKDQGENQ